MKNDKRLGFYGTGLLSSSVAWFWLNDSRLELPIVAIPVIFIILAQIFRI